MPISSNISDSIVNGPYIFHTMVIAFPFLKASSQGIALSIPKNFSTVILKEVFVILLTMEMLLTVIETLHYLHLNFLISLN